jgi:DNA-binding transcriptional LysR family regulator
MNHDGSQTIRVGMDWKSLPAFLAVARNSSLRAAAEQIGGTHATLRRQIEALEAQLGTQLFRRGADGLPLTATGQRLLPQALEADAVGRKLFPLSIGVVASRDYIDRALPVAGRKEQGLSWIGYGNVPELASMIAASAFPEARIRHSVPDPEMHLHLVRAGAGMTFLATWVTSVFPELQRVPGTKLDQRRATWVLLHGELRRVRRVRLFVDYLCDALLERRAAFLQSQSNGIPGRAGT